MRVSLRWLREFIDIPLTNPDEIGQVLAGLGHEVDAIEILGIPFTGVEVAQVASIRPHPDADKIRLLSLTPSAYIGLAAELVRHIDS